MFRFTHFVDLFQDFQSSEGEKIIWKLQAELSGVAAGWSHPENLPFKVRYSPGTYLAH